MTPHLFYFYPSDNLAGIRRLANRGIAADLVYINYINPPFAANNDFPIDDTRANSISASGRPPTPPTPTKSAAAPTSTPSGSASAPSAP